MKLIFDSCIPDPEYRGYFILRVDCRGNRVSRDVGDMESWTSSSSIKFPLVCLDPGYTRGLYRD
jgi:hypothetical protein